ncbi:Putative membrane protein involved in the export teichoic acid [Latilactobacillus curvatus]|uniref:lipopolysaccharide biosynthesis protein n=1 Tax=Latilactobacillus curvatus TaxID=28038 RepID=UPI000A1B6F48|nr:oligosaccharide flippase family protein [Latilactobacillus curvatus]SMH69112.1 Putative membrane protein involved in the export teichoic acid [Latilactobacillus curvatus]
MNSQRKIGAVLSYFNIVLKNIVNFLYTPFLLRYVGQGDYGLFQMTNSVMISLSLLSMGFSSAYVKFYISYKVKKDQEKINKLNALFLLLFLTISFIALIIGGGLIANINLFFGASLSSRELRLTKYLMVVMVLSIAITFISSVFDSNITVNEQFAFQQSRQLIQTLLVPVICIPLVLLGVGVLSIVLTQFIVTLIFLIINVNYCIRKLEMSFNFNKLPIGLLKSLTAFSFFIFLNQMVDIVNNNSPNFILGMFKGARLVATFAIANQIKNMFFMLSTSLSSIFVPQINILVNKDEGKDELTNLMIKVGRIQSAILFCVVGGFISIGRYFVLIWAGKENLDAYLLVIVMVLPSIIPLSQNVGIEIQRAMNKHIFRSIVYSIFAVINIIVTIIGIKYIGLMGAALGYVISILLANGILMNWYYQVKMNLNMKKYWRMTTGILIPFFVATGVSLLIGNIIEVNSLVKFIIVGLIYLIIYSIIYLKFIATDYERNLIRPLKK